MLEQSSHLVVARRTVAASMREQWGRESERERERESDAERDGVREIEREREGEQRREPEGVIQREREQKGGEFKLSAMLWDRLIC